MPQREQRPQRETALTSKRLTTRAAERLISDESFQEPRESALDSTSAAAAAHRATAQRKPSELHRDMGTRTRSWTWVGVERLNWRDRRLFSSCSPSTVHHGTGGGSGPQSDQG